MICLKDIRTVCMTLFVLFTDFLLNGPRFLCVEGTFFFPSNIDGSQYFVLTIQKSFSSGSLTLYSIKTQFDASTTDSF